MTPAGRHVVFIHGLWLHASSWAPWTELFQTAGYAPVAPGWPGAADTVEETRSHPGQVAGKAAVRGRRREPVAAVAGQDQHGQQDPRAPAADRWGPRPHRPGGDYPIDPQAVSQVSGHHRPAGVQRPGPLTD